MSSDDEPRLPRELEREIFYTAALLHPYAIPTLLRVARRVLIWVEPLLYRTLEFGNRPYHVSQLNAASTKPPEFLARAVRCLVLYGRHDYTAAHGILSFCTGVTGLAVVPGPFVQNLLPVLSTMPIQRFAGYLSQIMDVTQESPPEAIAAHPQLRRLTHLDLFDPLSISPHAEPAIIGILPSLPSLTHLVINRGPQFVPHIDAISSLPFLTHLAINGPIGSINTMCEWLERILKTCRSLRILVLLAFSRLDVARASRDIPESVRDPRLVLSSYESWFESVLDGPNYWTVVEDFVARKRRGEVDASVFLAERA
ncbi:hypothetical protein C8F01DRAFT_1260550 [Mycena amicta]|nr:hypothetical protein C8F01DRAFT_1260550 [Mycena amicta]